MERRLSRRLDAEVAESAGHAVHPQADVAFSMPQPIDHQAGLRAAVDRDADCLGYFPDVCCFGMTTRNATIAPLDATAFQIDAFGGDQFYAVSEFQAIGDPIPEPASLVLLGTGLAGVARRRLRRH
jgi:hypothetical protein